MSYILDALRKSEQQRQRGAAPLLFTTQISSNVEKRPAFLLYGLAAAILICAGILIGWLRPWQHDETETTKNSNALTQSEENPPQIVYIPQSLPTKSENSRKPELVVPIQKSISTMKLAPRADGLEQAVSRPFKVEVPASKSNTSTAAPKAPEQTVDKAAMLAVEKVVPTSIEANGTNSTTEIAQESKIIAMTELPLAIQQEIPMMTISGYAYSSIPKERSVGINDRLLQEGEYLSPGLRLEQISADGLVFSYKKYFFRHSL
jgi:general secretion pathway protein B